MSLCYDFQKWTIISLSAITISLMIGLVGLAYGQNQSISLETEYRINYHAYKQEANEICFPIPDPAYDATHDATAPLPEEKAQCYIDMRNKHGLEDPKYNKIDKFAIEFPELANK